MQVCPAQSVVRIERHSLAAARRNGSKRVVASIVISERYAAPRHLARKSEVRVNRHAVQAPPLLVHAERRAEVRHLVDVERIELAAQTQTGRLQLLRPARE